MRNYPTYRLTLRALPDESGDLTGIRRLRQALKTLLRGYRLRTVYIEEVKLDNDQDQDNHNQE